METLSQNYPQYQLNCPYDEADDNKKLSPFPYFPKNHLSEPPFHPSEPTSPLRIVYHPHQNNPPFFYPPNIHFTESPFHLSKQSKYFGKAPQDILAHQQQLLLIHQQRQRQQRQQLFIQEPIFPEFPPANFNIPDITSSNSVYGDTQEDPSTSPSKDKPPIFSFYACLPLPSLESTDSLNNRTTESTNPTPESHEDTSSAETSLFPLQAPPPNNPPPPLPQPQKSQTTTNPPKKTKSPKKRKRKDPNEPQKPVSAYSLFFRSAQAAIKSQNPNASFGDVSKIVASMWDGLDDEVKSYYKCQMEVAKKEYLKQLAIYKSTLNNKDSPSSEKKMNEDISPPPLQQPLSNTPHLILSHPTNLTPLHQNPLNPNQPLQNHSNQPLQNHSNHAIQNSISTLESLEQRQEMLQREAQFNAKSIFQKFDLQRNDQPNLNSNSETGRFETLDGIFKTSFESSFPRMPTFPLPPSLQTSQPFPSQQFQAKTGNFQFDKNDSAHKQGQPFDKPPSHPEQSLF